MSACGGGSVGGSSLRAGAVKSTHIIAAARALRFITVSIFATSESGRILVLLRLSYCTLVRSAHRRIGNPESDALQAQHRPPCARWPAAVAVDKRITPAARSPEISTECC